MDEDNHHPQQQSSSGDLRHLFSPSHMLLAPPQSLLSAAAAGGAFTPFQYPKPQYEMMAVMDGARANVPYSTASATAAARWPREETLRLLEVRSRLDHHFKEATQKGPLWDQVSRILSEEYGHQRSGKKCREKFENVYKYYKKTRVAKGGRQDGKNYRFFRQLESIYGQQQQQPSSSIKTPTANTSLHDQEEGRFSLSMSSSELQTTSSDNYNPNREKRRGKRRWKAKIMKFIEMQMSRIMENQESWLNKVMSKFECKEKERMMRDQEWRNKEFERVEEEHRLWAEERAWIEARDRALIDALQSHIYNHGVDIGIGGGGRNLP